jgi:hypothetical protein
LIFRVCRHIKTDGVQCQSPALRDDKFCYFHTELRRRQRPLAAGPDTSTMRPSYDRDGNFKGMEPLGPPSGGIELGLLEDTASVQVAISTVVNALAGNRLELRRATALLYGLQLASSNCRSLKKDAHADPEKMPRQVVTDADDQPIAQPGLMRDTMAWLYEDTSDELNEDDEEDIEDDNGNDDNGDDDNDDDDNGDDDSDDENDDDLPDPEEKDEQDDRDAEGKSLDHTDADVSANASSEDAGEYDKDDFDESDVQRALSEFRAQVRQAICCDNGKLSLRSSKTPASPVVSGTCV